MVFRSTPPLHEFITPSPGLDPSLAVDAGATSIQIQIRTKSREIIVHDNGCGMDQKTLEAVGQQRGQPPSSFFLQRTCHSSPSSKSANLASPLPSLF